MTYNKYLANIWWQPDENQLPGDPEAFNMDHYH